MEQQIQDFIAEVSGSLARSTFVKLTLGNYKGADEHLQKLFVRPVVTKKGNRLLFQFRGKTSERVKNYDLKEAPERIAASLNAGFRSGHLFTKERDVQLTIGKRSAKLSTGKPTFRSAATASHDRVKSHRIDPDAFYLKALGISTDRGEVRAEQRDKWKQINKFIEVLDGLYDRSGLLEMPSLNIVDMGSGKGYLTFAVFDHFRNTLGRDVKLLGIEGRRELVDLCNGIARAGGFDGLTFIHGTIADLDPGRVDILIALHACDTATDDALFRGIESRASIIVASPCCHKELKKQLRSPQMLAGVLKHPVLLERTAETLTDGIRTMLLEAAGYRTRIFEFVAAEHTPKNNLIVATRTDARGQVANSQATDEILSTFGIEHQHLSDLLKRRKDQYAIGRSNT